MAYTKQEWSLKTPITPEKLNHIEDGIGNTNDFMGEVLWKNSNPNDTFIKQSVTLKKPLSDFKEYAILYKFYKIDTQLMNTGRIPVNYGTKINGNWEINSARQVNENHRQLDNYMEFGEGRVQTSNYTIQETDNDRCIPVYVIGYKNSCIDI